MTEVILHIGAGKTGSTALQNFLSYNRGALAARQVAYPRLPGPDTDRPGVAHNPLAYALMAGAGETSLRAARRALESAARSADRIILSAEVFYMRPREQEFGDDFEGYARAKRDGIRATAELLSGFTVRPICYVRRQDHWLESVYQERVKTWKPVEPDAAAFAERIREPHFRWQLDLWAKQFGEQNIVVRPYDRARMRGGDVIDDFLAATGLPTGEGLTRPPDTVHTRNPRLSRDVFELQRILRQLAPRDEDKRSLQEALYELSEQERGRRGDDPPTWAALLEPAERQRILERFAPENRAVARRFLGRDDGALFPEDADATPPPPDEPYPGLGAARAVELTLELQQIRVRPRHVAVRTLGTVRRWIHTRAAWLRPVLSPAGRVLEQLRQRRRRGY